MLRPEEAAHLLAKLDACTLAPNRLAYMDTGFR
jgi:hypothetical protein